MIGPRVEALSVGSGGRLLSVVPQYGCPFTQIYFLGRENNEVTLGRIVCNDSGRGIVFKYFSQGKNSEDTYILHELCSVLRSEKPFNLTDISLKDNYDKKNTEEMSQREFIIKLLQQIKSPASIVKLFHEVDFIMVDRYRKRNKSGTSNDDKVLNTSLLVEISSISVKNLEKEVIRALSTAKEMSGVDSNPGGSFTHFSCMQYI